MDSMNFSHTWKTTLFRRGERIQMEQAFFAGNRARLYESLPEGTVALLFAGHAPRKTNDEDYPFFADRSFVYMTGIEQAHSILLAEKTAAGAKEMLFLLPPNAHKERWTGARLKPDEARAISGVEDVRYVDDFEPYLHALLRNGQFDRVALDLYKADKSDRDTDAFKMAQTLRRHYAAADIINLSAQISRQRTIKQPCEIAAMREAVKITRAGILAMMRASVPGMYEYQYKAEFDHALTSRGCLWPAYPSIISAGQNNFCIHYYAYTGQARDGDMILNDVGAQYEGLMNDVSRGWPCNGKFSERQKLLYNCAYRTSEHLFSLIKPGMKMSEVDPEARRFDWKQLHDLGLVGDYEDAGKLIWHNGAHHVGYDVHDRVLVEDDVIRPGMVFCVDIGIYCEEWGIGFRLEDNCLVTEDGCENLTASIPRTIEEIEAVMADPAAPRNAGK